MNSRLNLILAFLEDHRGYGHHILSQSVLQHLLQQHVPELWIFVEHLKEEECGGKGHLMGQPGA